MKLTLSKVRNYVESNRPDNWEDCDCCEGAHPPGFAGDCRDDANRWPSDACVARLSTIDEFTRGYLECALWTSDPTPGSGEWQARFGWSIDDIDPASIARAIEVCADFQQANRADLDEVSDTYHADDYSHGHDFWLTRNRHGAGFWDRGYDLNGLGDKLTVAAQAYGEAYCHGPETTDQGSCTEDQWDAWDGVIYIDD